MHGQTVVHQMMVVMIFVVAHEVLMEVAADDVELMLCEQLVSSSAGVLLVLGVEEAHERRVKLIQRQT